MNSPKIIHSTTLLSAFYITGSNMKTYPWEKKHLKALTSGLHNIALCNTTQGGICRFQLQTFGSNSAHLCARPFRTLSGCSVTSKAQRWFSTQQSRSFTPIVLSLQNTGSLVQMMKSWQDRLSIHLAEGFPAKWWLIVKCLRKMIVPSWQECWRYSVNNH